jgi:hypothetical protein
MVVLLVMLVPHIHSRIHEASSRATPGVSIGIRIGAIHYCRKRDGTETKLFSAQYSVMKRELTGDQMTTWLSLGRQSECVEGRIQEQTGTDGELTAAEARNVGWVGGLGWNLAGWSAGWWDGARRGGLGVERLLLALLLCCACCLLGWLGAAR